MIQFKASRYYYMVKRNPFHARTLLSPSGRYFACVLRTTQDKYQSSKISTFPINPDVRSRPPIEARDHRVDQSSSRSWITQQSFLNDEPPLTIYGSLRVITLMILDFSLFRTMILVKERRGGSPNLENATMETQAGA